MKSMLFGIATSMAFFGIAFPAYSDTFFPMVNAGDTFSGQISIDPTVPFDPVANFYHSPSLGTITINLGGKTFSEILTVVSAPVGFGDYSWFGGGGAGRGPNPSLDGISLASGLVDLFLYGSTTST